MADDRIIIEIDLDDDSLKSAFKNVRNESKKTAEGSSKDFSKVQGRLKDLGKGVTSRFKSMGLAIIAAGTALSTYFLTKKSIEVAIQQEDAIQKLNTSLALAGTYSVEASAAAQQFARELQRTTKVGDEATLSMLALARNFARSNEEAIALTRAAIDLDAATGIGLESSIKNLGKTFSGLTGELGESLPIIKTLTAEQLKAGEAVKLLQDRFGGAAAEQVKTFSGSVAQLSNNFGDFLESVGGIATKSPALIAVFSTLSKAFSQLAENLNFLTQGRDLFKPIIIGTLNFAEALIRVGQVFGSIGQLIVAGFLAIETVIAGVSQVIVEIVGAVGGAIGGLIKLVDEDLGNSIDNFLEKEVLASRELTRGLAETTAEVFQGAFNFDVGNALVEFTDDLQLAAETSTEATTVIKNNFQKTVATVATATKQISQLLQKGIIKTIAFTAEFIGRSLIRSQGGFKAFANGILSIIGDMAIQIGITLVGIGIGIEALKASLLALTGGPAIAAGLALIAIGGLLKELSSGGVPETAATPTVGAASPEDVGFVPEQIEDEEGGPATFRGNSVVVNIQGDVFDNEETALRIAELINDATDNQGAQFA